MAQMSEAEMRDEMKRMMAASNKKQLPHLHLPRLPLPCQPLQRSKRLQS